MDYKKIISPIVALAEAVDKMGKDDLTVRVAEDQSGDELGSLAQSFNRMAGTIEQHVSESLSLKLQHEQILNCAGDGIYGVDLDGNCIFINSAAAKMFGRDAADLLGQHVHSLMHYRKIDGTPYPAQECQIYSVLRDGVAKHVSEDCFLRYDGSYFPVEYTSTPIIDNDRITGAVVVYRDITSRKQTEEELRRHREDLEELVLQRTAEAVAANKTKSAFLANMSHELRTPLNSIIGFSDMLISGMSGELTISQKQHLGYIHESGEHLLSLINDILDLSKVEAGKLDLEIGMAKVKNILNTSIMMLKEKAMTHNIRTNLALEPDADIEVEADERKLKQIVFNLMSNAVKFTPDGGTVNLRARKISENDRYFIRISVEDSGIGIKEEDIGRLFTPFMQVATTYIKEYQGTGLGLALTKQLVELHGGSIWVASEFGKGSAFTFQFPLKQEGRDV